MFCRIALLFLCVAHSLAVNDNTNCYIEGKTKDYNGNIRHTIDGKKCLNWTACPKYETYNDTGFSYIRDTDFPDGSVSAASNYCRDPAPYGYVWCLVKDRWDNCVSSKCALNSCNTDCYFKGQSKEYRGFITQTQGGTKCLNWKDHRGFEHIRDVNFPDGSVDKAANFCRDPDASGTPWCHDSADDHWDFCNVPVCSTGAN